MVTSLASTATDDLVPSLWSRAVPCIAKDCLARRQEPGGIGHLSQGEFSILEAKDWPYRRLAREKPSCAVDVDKAVSLHVVRYFAFVSWLETPCKRSPYFRPETLSEDLYVLNTPEREGQAQKLKQIAGLPSSSSSCLAIILSLSQNTCFNGPI